MANTSANGVKITVTSSVTFPGGFDCSNVSDSADLFDTPQIDIAETAKTANGEIVTWSKAVPIPLTINLIPDSPSDQNMQILAFANLPKQGERPPAGDVITITLSYPDGIVKTFLTGTLTKAPLGTGVDSIGKKKVKTYELMFQDVTQ